MTRVIIAEKASVARSIARALGGYQSRGERLVKGPNIITWAVGHLVELMMPDEYDASLKRWSMATLPFAPSVLRLKVIEDRRDRFDAIRAALRDATLVVNACDAGREGELIFRRILQMAGYEGPVKRLWISSYTDAAIRQGFRDLRPSGRYDGLHESARVRSEGDWIVGLNGTRALTVTHGGGVLLTLGRVQTPVLAGIVVREQEIRDFKPEPYWLLEGAFEHAAGSYKGLWFRPGQGAEDEDDGAGADRGQGSAGKSSREDKSSRGKGAGKAAAKAAPRASWIGSSAEAEELRESLAGCPARVLSAQQKRRSEAPPQLFDLTSLQRIAHMRYRMTAKETLKAAQSLYEGRKLITYPRTDSRYISRDLVPTLAGRLRAVADRELGPFVDGLLERGVRPGGRVVNDARVTDHHAILPTEVAGRDVDLPVAERRIYGLVARQLVAALSDAAIWLDSRIVTGVEARPGSRPVAPFGAGRSGGAVERGSGGEARLEHFLTRGRVLREAGWRAVIPPKKGESALPDVAAEDAVRVAALTVRSEQTKPPARYTEASLLKFMETAGRHVDDEALREALREHGLGTPATRAEIIEKLKKQRYIEAAGKALSPTALGEMLISLIPMEDLKSPELTGRWEKRIHDVQRDPSRAGAFRDEIVALTRRLVEALGQAGGRKAAVREAAESSGLTLRDGRGGGRSGRGKGRSRGRKSGAGAGSSGRRSGAGKRGSGKGGSGKGGKSRGRAARGGRGTVTEGRGLGPCPRCGEGGVIKGRRDFGCDRWRSGCRFVLSHEGPHGRAFTEAQVRDLLRRGKTRPLQLKSGGRSFRGRILLKGEVLEVAREPA